MKSQERTRTADAVVPLDRLVPGQSALVVAIGGGDALAQRLLDHGFWAGAEVRLVRRAPLGDPCLFLLHGMRLALRSEEAARVLVRIAGAEAP